MKTPNDRYYVATHEWALVDGETLLVGITDHAQEQLGDLVFVGEFKVGAQVQAGATVCIVESVKAACDIYAPVAGRVLEANEEVVNKPELIQSQPCEARVYRLTPEEPKGGTH